MVIVGTIDFDFEFDSIWCQTKNVNIMTHLLSLKHTYFDLNKVTDLFFIEYIWEYDGNNGVAFNKVGKRRQNSPVNITFTYSSTYFKIDIR